MNIKFKFLTVGFVLLLLIVTRFIAVSCVNNNHVAQLTRYLIQLVNKEISIPLSNNAYVTHQAKGGKEIVSDKGLTNWTNPSSIYSAFFRVADTGELKLKIKAKVSVGKSTIKVTINGEPFTVVLSGDTSTTYTVGTVSIAQPGYVKVDFQGIEKSKHMFGEVSHILLSGSAIAQEVIYASKLEDKHWDRRGVAVSLGYEQPANAVWFYNEVTVEEGEDPIASFYMANGFDAGYFGMQVRDFDRTFQYSVWDSEKGKAILLEKGKNVQHTGFGHEGSGGATTLIYNWRSGTTYKFLTRGMPDGFGNTLFSAWVFSPESDSWHFIATYRREKVSSYLQGLHSFIENWSEELGYVNRKAKYSNQWARDVGGKWVELVKARASGGQKVRKDNTSGLTADGQFFAQIGGFGNTHTPDGWHERKANGIPPVIDFDKLPNVNIDKYLKK